jgi:phosphinothricin acetyltransferase
MFFPGADGSAGPTSGGENINGVRIATAADARAIAAIYAPYVLETAISFEEVPPEPEEMAARMASILDTYPYLVFDDGQRVLGYAYASQHRSKPAYRWSVETTVYVDRLAHRGGIGRALYAELIDLLTRQGFQSAFAGIVPPNPGSVALHETMGFTYLGTFPAIGFKFGKLQDLGWWRRGLSPEPPSRDPTPFKSLGKFIISECWPPSPR